MDLTKSRCWVEIDMAALVENCRVIHSLLPPGCRLMNVLKADAYGHGAVPVAKALEAAFPQDWIGVACLAEGLELRQSGIRQEILIFGYTPPQAAEVLAEHRLTQTLLSAAYTAALSASAVAQGVAVACHLKLDSGMTRIGYPAYGEELPAALEAIGEAYRLPGLEVGGIFTHFSSAYGHTPEDEAYTAAQFQRFLAVCRALGDRGISVGLRHCANSPATLNSPEYALDLCRVGTALYGVMPGQGILRPATFTCAMTWKARVAMVRPVAEGTPISYGREAVAQEDMVLAIVSAGDADGYPRQLTNRGRVSIHAKTCPVVGRVCMDMLLVDVTQVPEAAPGDEVILLGGEAGGYVPCQWLYGPLGLGPSAITCGIRSRVPRVYGPC